MIDVNAPRFPLIVNLPQELIEDLRILAGEKQMSVDEVVMEACFEYSEPYFWQRAEKEWRKEHPNAPVHEFGIDGEEILPDNTVKDCTE